MRRLCNGVIITFFLKMKTELFYKSVYLWFFNFNRILIYIEFVDVYSSIINIYVNLHKKMETWKKYCWNYKYRVNMFI